MLSRIAESLFWMNRYVERAEGMMRMLKINYVTSLDRNEKEKYNWSPVLQIFTELDDAAIEKSKTIHKPLYFISLQIKAIQILYVPSSPKRARMLVVCRIILPEKSGKASTNTTRKSTANELKLCWNQVNNFMPFLLWLMRVCISTVLQKSPCRAAKAGTLWIWESLLSAPFWRLIFSI